MDLAISFLIWTGALLALLVIAALLRVTTLRPGLLALSIVIYAGYFAAIALGPEFIPVDDYFSDLKWNWAGKIAAIAHTLVWIVILGVATRWGRPANMGVTLKQAPGSTAPALVATALLVGSAVGLELLAKDGLSLGAERLLYQASMPGLDEEPFFRGVFLAALTAAAPSGKVSILGAPISLAGLAVTMIFGLGHAVIWAEGGVHANWIVFAVTAWLGFGLLWIRERTGSVVIPILAHNAINFISSFF